MNSKQTFNFPTRISIFAALMCCLVLLGGAGFTVASEYELTSEGPSSASRDLQPIGSVSLVLGRAFIESAGNNRERVRMGMMVRQADRIVTESNGHVHIRFIDEALVSVRPNSELEILAYVFNTEDPDKSSIKFNLLEGTARAVSGNAAKAARQRFRLNTPIAAIGVRGTDFVVTTTATLMTVLVNEGAVVVAPFSDECVAQGFGPCSTNAVELTADSLQLIEFDSNMALPRLVPLVVSEESTEQLQGAASNTGAQPPIVEASGDEEDKKATSKEVVMESVTSVGVADDAAADGTTADGTTADDTTANNATTQNATTQNATTQIANAVTGNSQGQKTILPAYQTGYTPVAQVAVTEAKQRQLVWGRYGDGKGDLERITLPYDEASRGREITVGSNFEYYLFRPESGEKQVAKGLGTIGFTLNSAQAFYSDGTDIFAVAVSGGGLTIGFQEGQFSTYLNLNHSSFGDLIFQASGRLYDGGYFHSRNDSQRIAGAVSLDGQEAGYFFNLLQSQGTINGLTLWNAGQ
jgi:hypothetical protein